MQWMEQKHNAHILTRRVPNYKNQIISDEFEIGYNFEHKHRNNDNGYFCGIDKLPIECIFLSAVAHFHLQCKPFSLSFLQN